MSSLGCSSIVGYGSHLLLKHINLPLKYLLDEPPSDAVDAFKSKLFGFGGFVDLSSQDGLFFSSLQYGVDNDRKTIHLIPVLIDEVTSLSVQFQSIQVHLPHPLIGNKMASFQFVPLTSNEEPYIVIDLIDESFLFITLKIELSDFTAGNLNNRLALDSFNEWVNISVPYSFELRCSPFIIQALDTNNIIVSLKDGGMLHFSRPSVLSNVDIYNFSEASSLISFNFGGFLRLNDAEEVVDGISHNAVVDAVKISEFEFATVSVRKMLKIWDLRSHRQVKQSIHLDGNLSGSASWLSTIPSKYMQLHNVGESQFLTLMYTVENSSQSASGYAFKTFEILPENSLCETTQFLLNPERPHSSLAADSNAFKIQDFHVENSGESKFIHFYTLWKSNTYSVLTRHEIDSHSWTVTQISRSIPQSNHLPDELFIRHDEAYYHDLIFNSGSYDDIIVATALTIFKSKSGHVTNALAGTSLRQDVEQTLITTSKTAGVSVYTLWNKLFLICEEFRKLSREANSILITPSLVLVCEVHGIGAYKDAHFFERFEQGEGGDELSILLSTLSSKFSTNTKRKLMEEIKNLSSITSADSSRLATTYLTNRISEEDVAHILEKVAKLPKAMDSIDSLIGRVLPEKDTLNESSRSKFGVGLGVFSRLLTVNTFKNVKRKHESILLNVFILFLLCENSSSVLEYLSRIVQRISTYTVFDKVFDICFETSSTKSELERENINLLENSIFWTAAVAKYPELMHLIKEKKYNRAFDYYAQTVLGSHFENFLLDVVLNLLNRDEALVVRRKFGLLIDVKSPMDKFLSGLLSLTTNNPAQFFATFSDYETFRAINQESSKKILYQGLHSHPELKTFLSSIFAKSLNDVSSQANYFHALAQLSKAYSKRNNTFGTEAEANKLFLKGAFKFEKKAFQIIEENGLQDGNLLVLKTALLRNIFDESLELLEYDEAINSLEKLSSLLTHADLKLFFNRLIRTLIARREIKRAFSVGKNSLFVKHYSYVDSILLETANNDLILNNAVKCYEFLYAWRLFGCSADGSTSKLGDKRGAVEALYIFITRFKLEKDNLGMTSNESEDFRQFKLKVLELYMIIINCLKTFEDPDDRWFIKRDTAKRLGVFSLSDITLEYYEWLKELEKDLSDGSS